MEVGTGFFKRSNRIQSWPQRKNTQSNEEDGNGNDLLNHLTLEFASDWEMEGTLSMKDDTACSWYYHIMTG